MLINWLLKKCKVVIFIFILFTSLIVLIGCKESNSKITIKTLFDSEWISQIEKMNNVSYVEDIDIAFFTYGDNELLLPSLYSTYAIIGMSSLTNQEIKEKIKIITWINSLQNANGGYDDPNTTADELSETFWALNILNKLGTKPNNNIIINNFLFNHLQANGLFYYDNSIPKDDSISEYIIPTYFCLEILKILNTQSDHADNSFNIHFIMTLLSNYANNNLLNSNLTISDEEIDKTLLALILIQQFEPNLIPQNAQEWAKQVIDKLNLQTPDNFMAIIPTLNDYFKLCLEMNLDLTKIKYKISNFLQEVLQYAGQTNGGLSAFSANFPDPMLSYDAVKLFTVIGMSYPKIDELLSYFDNYRVDKGWTQIYILQPSIEGTYYGLAISDFIGVKDKYNKHKLNIFINSYFEPNCKITPREAYYAFKTCNILNNKISEEYKLILTMEIIQYIDSIDENDPKSINNDMAYNLLLADEISINIKEVNINKLILYKDKLKQIIESGNQNMKSIFCLYIVNDFIKRGGGASLNDDTVVKLIMELQDNDGLFRMDYSSPVADLDSTYLAVWVLIKTGNINLINKTSLNTFINNCHTDYGFANFKENELLENGYSPGAEMRTNYEGFCLTNFCYLNEL